MDDTRYGKAPRWRILALGLPWALMLTIGGGYLTLVSWGVIGDEESKSLSMIGPLCAGLGIALGFVCLRPRP
ncbi:hypothetical protein ASE01_21410 [Nocardioides sp. Root190]|uniref:hypothetical protein n=1 Tax=Nocardioides sp. Root190 TaxID=1736488 RepID=UPI0006FCBEC8|nr:hypothetical protein [Nocardioides sp. Root190]KRB73302.1 hypothetical protein ASE01_21410 [Nocardioides sp. Root190]